MSGAVWAMVAVGVFALVMVALVALVVLLVVGRLRGRVPDPDAGPPEFVPHPRGESIPPTGSR